MNDAELFHNFHSAVMKYCVDHNVPIGDDNVELSDNGDGNVLITRWDIQGVVKPSNTQLKMYTVDQCRPTVKKSRIEKLEDRIAILEQKIN